AQASENVSSVIARLTGNAFDSVYVIDEKGHLQGLVCLLSLLTASPPQKLSEIMITEPIIG
ncbi:hypothetical protein CBP27_20520, partial [Fischerella thermalis WC542]|uniref:hypothetical protein n=1 Tax=Fischerella thermalis TaxID=372787 RepID=UPI000CA7D73D